MRIPKTMFRIIFFFFIYFPLLRTITRRQTKHYKGDFTVNSLRGNANSVFIKKIVFDICIYLLEKLLDNINRNRSLTGLTTTKI